MKENSAHKPSIEEEERRDNYLYLLYTRGVKRRIVQIILFFILISSIFSNSDYGDTSLSALKYSALKSVSYYGHFSDIFVNPASLPLLKGATDYQISLSPSESYDTSIWEDEPKGYMQNFSNELQGTVVSGRVALSAKISNRIANRNLRDGKLYFDNYLGFDIELALAYTFLNHISIGARLGGGNSVARLNKSIDGVVDLVANSYFSAFSRLTGTERFNVNVGLLAYWGNFSLGIVSDDILGQEEKETAFDHFISNTTLSLSYKGNEYTKDGDLILLVPRISIDIRAVGIERVSRSISVMGDVTFQLSKDVFLDGGVKYSYSLSKDGELSPELAITLYGGYENLSLMINLVFLEKEKENFKSAIIFSYST